MAGRGAPRGRATEVAPRAGNGRAESVVGSGTDPTGHTDGGLRGIVWPTAPVFVNPDGAARRDTATGAVTHSDVRNKRTGKTFFVFRRQDGRSAYAHSFAAEGSPRAPGYCGQASVPALLPPAERGTTMCWYQAVDTPWRRH